MKRLYLILLLLPILVTGQDFEKIRDSLKIQYEYIGQLKNGIAEARTKKSKYTLLNKDGKQLFAPKYDYITIAEDGWTEAGIRHGKSMKRGYINKDGSLRIPIVYDLVFMPSTHEIFVTINGKMGVLDAAGNAVIPTEYDNLIDAASGYYFVEKSGASALFRKSEKLTDFIFTNSTRFKNGLSAVQLHDGSTTIIDTTGNRLFMPIKNHKITHLEKEYAIIVNQKHLYGTINLDGNSKIACKYERIEPTGDELIVTSAGLKGLTTQDGKELIPARFSIIYRAGNNFIVHDQNGERLVNRNNISVIPGTYDTLFWYKNQFVIAEIAGKNALFDETGKLLLPFEYSFCGLWLNIVFCNKDKNCYVLNLNNPKQPVELEDAENFKPSVNYLYQQNNTAIYINKGRFGIMSVNTNVLVPPIYDDLQQIENSDEFIAKRNGKYGIINTQGEVKQPLVYDSANVAKEVIILRRGKEKVHYVYPNNITVADFKNPSKL